MKTREQLISELQEMRERIAALEKSDAENILSSEYLEYYEMALGEISLLRRLGLCVSLSQFHVPAQDSVHTRLILIAETFKEVVNV